MQTALNPYLNFNGNCREAMNFYKECLGGELSIFEFDGAPMDVPAEAKNKIMHAHLQKNGLTLMASDSMPGQDVEFGSNVSLSLNCESQEEVDTYFNKLAAGGTISMPLQDTFWGAYFGMLTDKFGVHWMFNFDKPQTP